MNGKCGECSADLEPVVWVQGGTFGYIDRHSNRNFRILPYCINTPPLPFRNIIGRTVPIDKNDWVCGGRNMEQSEKVKDKFKQRENKCGERRRKRQESDSGHFVKSLYKKKRMIQFKLPLKQTTKT